MTVGHPPACAVLETLPGCDSEHPRPGFRVNKLPKRVGTNGEEKTIFCLSTDLVSAAAHEDEDDGEELQGAAPRCLNIH